MLGQLRRDQAVAQRCFRQPLKGLHPVPPLCFTDPLPSDQAANA